MHLFHIPQCSIQYRNENIEQMHFGICELGPKNITYSTAVIGAEHKSEFKLKKTTHIFP